METVLVETKPWWQSKTIWTNISAIVGAASVFVTTGDTHLLGPAALGVINLFLRVITKAPLE